MMTGFKKAISAIAFCIALVLAAFVFLPKTVMAEEQTEIKPDTPIKVEFDSYDSHWFKFISTKKQVIKIESTNDIDIHAYLYEGSQTGDPILDKSLGPHTFNNCRCLIDSGDYWIRIEPTYSSLDSSTDIILSVLEHTKVAAYDADSFPDSVFRDYVKTKFDIWDDGQLTYDEMMLAMNINVEELGITDLTGIEKFEGLRSLRCSKNKFYSLTISNKPELTNLVCARSKVDMDSIVIENCPKLTYLECYEDYLATLSLSGCDQLYYLSCGNNFRLKELDVSNMTRLENLQVENNTMTSLKFDGCTSLEYLYCYWNCLESLDVSGLPSLKYLDCRNSYFSTLTSLTLGNNDNLSDLICYGNGISQLDISGCPRLIQTYEGGIQEEDEKTVTYGKYQSSDCLWIDKTVKINKIKPTATPTATPSAIPTATPTATATPTTKPTAKPTSASSISLSLDKKTGSVVCGKTLTLKATLKGSSSKITWKSSNTKVATVDASGKITAKMAGEVTITASAAGKSAKCKVTVLYKDVTNSKDFWFAPTNYLTAKGVVKGYDNQTKFKPANKCTRAQMVTFIWRLQGEPKPKATTCKFKDVKKTDYFYKACIWGNENKIVEGYKDGTFGPQIVCARKHAVTFLWRLAGKPSTKTTKNPFKDVKKSDYFYKATIWASEKKILAGYTDGTFRPNGDCLRRQMVTFLYKYDKQINGGNKK